MSVLNFPRIHFRGTMSWDPGLANNFAELFDGNSVEIRLPEGVTHNTFIAHVIDNIGDDPGQYGIWNYTGTHTCATEAGTVVTGGRLRAGVSAAADDPLIGKPVGLVGRLVDLDPEAVWNSQIYFDDFAVGADGVGLTAPRAHRLHSRWINFRRALDPLSIAGAAGAVWQTAVPLGSVRFDGADRSPLLASLRAAAEASGADGIAIRFATYRTLYFQNGIRNDSPHRPRNAAELRALFQQGHRFSNPAYSQVVGTVGVWKRGESIGWPSGRFLAPESSVRAGIAGVAPFRLGPAVAEFDPPTRTLSLDLLHAVPELNANLDKADLGPLTVSVRLGSDHFDLGRISPDDYSSPAYLASGGIVDLRLPRSRWVDAALADGQLQVRAESRGTVLLAERELVAFVEERSTYAEKGATKTAAVRVLERGVPPSSPVDLFVTHYRGLSAVSGTDAVVPVGAGGVATVTLPTDQLGPIDLGLIPFRDTRPPAPHGLDITAGFFVSLRVLPTDAELDAIPDTELTFALVFEKVLRTWHLINPVMAGPGIGLPLDDEAAVTKMAAAVCRVTDAAAFEKFEYMPVTRDLSEGKRRLLHRWCNKQSRLHERLPVQK